MNLFRIKVAIVALVFSGLAAAQGRDLEWRVVRRQGLQAGIHQREQRHRRRHQQHAAALPRGMRGIHVLHRASMR